MSVLYFATSNQAKVDQVHGALAPFGIQVVGLGDRNIEVEEDGETARENASKKALANAKATGLMVFAMDNALWIDGLSEERQPGLYVRRLPGVEGRATDEQLLEYYSGIILELGGSGSGYWEFGIAVATPDGRLMASEILSPRKFRKGASSRIVPGYPIESIQIDPESGVCIADMSADEQASFWQRVIGDPLADFVKKALSELQA
jgi:hypothetical protein